MIDGIGVALTTSILMTFTVIKLNICDVILLGLKVISNLHSNMYVFVG